MDGYAVPRPVVPQRDFEDSSTNPKYVNVGRTIDRELKNIAAEEPLVVSNTTSGGG